MLKEHGHEYEYREYTEDPLSYEELQGIFDLLDVHPGTWLRKRDKMVKELGLTGDEPAETLLRYMSDYPTLLQRPIAILNGRAVVARPHEELLTLFA